MLEQRGSTAFQLTIQQNTFLRRSLSLKLYCPLSRQTHPKRTRQVSHHTPTHLNSETSPTHNVLPTPVASATPTGCRTNSTTSSTNNVYSVNSSQPLASYNMSSLPAGPGAGAGAITMAAAQAVQATAQVRESLIFLFYFFFCLLDSCLLLDLCDFCVILISWFQLFNVSVCVWAWETLWSTLILKVIGSVSDEGGQENIQSEGQLRSHQKQRLPAGPRVRSVPGQHGLPFVCPGLHPHPDSNPHHHLRL